MVNAPRRAPPAHRAQRPPPSAAPRARRAPPRAPPATPASSHHLIAPPRPHAGSAPPALTRPLPLRLPHHSIPTLNPWGVKLTLDTKTGGKGVVRIGCKEVGKQGLNAEIIGGKIIKPDLECRRVERRGRHAAHVPAWRPARARSCCVFGRLTAARASPRAFHPRSNGVIHVVDAVLIPIKPLPGNNGFSPDSELAK